MLIPFVAIACAILVTLALSIGRFARSESWRAMVTPLASIIGSGFLISGPILAREFGSAAIPAEIVLLLIAYAAGAVIRFNIIHVENYLAKAGFNDPVSWIARGTQGVLAIAYTISVAYYLKLLAEFLLKPLAVADGWHDLLSNGIVTAIVVVIVALAWGGSLHRVERVAQDSVSVKLGIIAGMLAGLACWWIVNPSIAPLPPAKLSWNSIPLLLGLVITVQGFETSRFIGYEYSQAVRVRTMRYAQWTAAAIYLLFLALLTPFLEQASRAEGVAGILDIMTIVAPLLGTFVLIGAVASQLSAAVADSIGSGGLLGEVSRGRLKPHSGFALAGGLTLLVVWLTNPFQIVAISSRAFALFYALQCVLAIMVSRRTGAGGWKHQVGFALVGLVCVVAAMVGAPAEG